MKTLSLAFMAPFLIQITASSSPQPQQARPKAALENVVLTLGTSGGISGRIRDDSNAPPTASIAFLRVQLRRAGNDPEMPRANTPKPDGTFRIDNVWSGEYRVSVVGLPQGFYVKGARFGDTDVLNEPLRYTGIESGVLDIVISPNVGTVTGIANDAAGQPSPGAQVVLIPNGSRTRTDLFKPAVSDSSGRFTITDVAPGDYILAAWEAIEPYSFFESDRIGEAERQGRAVRVTESSAQTVNATSIPSSAR